MSSNKPIDWKAKAAQAVKEGYFPGPWEDQLLKHVKDNFPQMAAELQARGQLEAYCKVRTHWAKESFANLVQSGMAPASAREIVQEQLFSVPTDQLPEGTPADVAEASVEDEARAGFQSLIRPRPKK